MGMMESIEKDPIVAFYLKMSKSTQMLGRLPIYSETILRLAFKQILNKFRVLETAEIHLYCKLLQLYYFDCYAHMDSLLMIFPHHSEEEIYDSIAEADTILAEWRLFTKHNLHIVAYKHAYMEILSEWCLRYVSVFRQVDKDALAWKTCELQSFLNSDIKFQKTWLRTLQNVIKTKDVWAREEAVTEEHLKICNIYRDIKKRLHPWVVENCALRRERPVKATAFLVAPDYADGGAASSSATAAVSDDESLYEAPPPKQRAATRTRQRTTNKRNHAEMLNEQPPAAEGYVMYGELNGEAEADSYVYSDDEAAAAAQEDFIPLNKKAKLERETESAERMTATTTTEPDYDYWERGFDMPKRKKYNSNSCSSSGSTSSSNKTKSGQSHHPVDGEKTTAATQKQEQQQQKLKQQLLKLQQQKLKQQKLQKLKEQQKLRQQQLHKLKQLQKQQQKLKQLQLQKQQAQANASPPPIVLNNLIRKQGIRSGRLPPTADTACSVSSSSASVSPYNNNEHEVRRKPDRGHLTNHVNDIKMHPADGQEVMLIIADEDVGQGSYRSVPLEEQSPDYVEDGEELDEEDKPQTETESDIECESELDEEDAEEEQNHVNKIHIEYEDDTLDEQEEDEGETQGQKEDQEESHEQEEGPEETEEDDTDEQEEDEEDTHERKDDEDEEDQKEEESPEKAEDEADDDEELDEEATNEQKEPAEEPEEDHDEEILIEAELEESTNDETESDVDSFDESDDEIVNEADESNDGQKEVPSPAKIGNGHNESFDEGHGEILEEVEIDERRVDEAGEILPESGETHEQATELLEEVAEAAESVDKAAGSVDEAAGSVVEAAESHDDAAESLDKAEEAAESLDDADETPDDDEHPLVIDEDAPMADVGDTADQDDETGRVATNLTASSERNAGDPVEVLTIVYESDTDYKPIEIEVVEPEETPDAEAYDIEYQSCSSDQEDARNPKACPNEDAEMKEATESVVGGDDCVKVNFDEEDSQSHPEDTYEDVEYLFECLPDEAINPQVQEAAPAVAQSSPEAIPAPPPPPLSCSEQSVEELLATYEDIDYLLQDVGQPGKEIPTPQVCVTGENIINDLSVAQIIDDQIPLEPQHMVAVEQAVPAETEKPDFPEISVAADEYIFMDEEIVYEEESVVAEEESLVQQIVETGHLDASLEEEQTIREQEIENMDLEDVEELETVIQHEQELEQESVIQYEQEEQQESIFQHEHEEEQESVIQYEQEEQQESVFQHEDIEEQESVIHHEDIEEHESVIQHEQEKEQESVIQHEDVEEQVFQHEDIEEQGSVIQHEHEAEQESIIRHEDVEEQVSVFHHEVIEDQESVIQHVHEEEKKTVGQYEDVLQQETDGQHESVEPSVAPVVQEQLAEHGQLVPQQETVVEQAAAEATEQEAFVQQQQVVAQQESVVLEQAQPAAAAEQMEAEPEDCFSTFTRESVAEWKDGEMYKFVEGCMGMWRVALFGGDRKEAMAEVVADTAEMECAEENVTPKVNTAVEQEQQVVEAAESTASPESPQAEPTDDCVMYDRDVDVVNEVVVSGEKPEEEEAPATAEVDRLASGITINVDYSPMIEECFDADTPKATDTLLHEPFVELAAFRPVDHVDHQYVMQQQQQYSQKKRFTEPLHTRLLTISDFEEAEPSHRCLQVELDLLQVRIDEATQAIEAQSSSEESNGGDSDKRGCATTTTTAPSNPSPDQTNESPGSQQGGDNSNDSRLHEPMSVDPMDVDPSASSSPHLGDTYNEAATTPPSASKEEIDSNDSGGGGGGGGGCQTDLFGAAPSATSPPRSLSQGDTEGPPSAAREDDKTPAPSPEAAMAALFHPDGVNEDDSDKHMTAGISDTPPSSSGSLHEPSKMELSLDFLISNTMGEPKFDAESLLAGGGSLGGSKRANEMLFGLGTLSTISAPHVYTSLHTTSTSTGTSTTTVMPLIPYFPALDSPATSPVSVAASATMQQVAPSQLSLMTSSYDDLEPTAELPVVSYEQGETLQPMDVDELSVTKNVLSEGKIIKKISHALAAKYVFQLRAYAIDNGHYAAMKLLDQIDRMFQGTY